MDQCREDPIDTISVFKCAMPCQNLNGHFDRYFHASPVFGDREGRACDDDLAV